ncbi:centromere protein Chl4/mis15/CENP-N [Podospora aff. communis PSN243]|uniref:Centromere protein Chl4/mis15/CENP-N n=1 Tax=Podospora aff. communis PSN243 TaxID=3040156 RepID=A0AAV9GVS7_9PEZI|nr:centromere protein Chl4/mis15/CENP-N [Podospora aff. communis PSN243]
MPRISIPTTGRLPSSLRVDPSNPAVFKILNRLSRASLLSIALDWLDENNQSLAAPYLRHPESEYDSEDENDFNPPARSLSALQELYADLQSRKGSKREVIDRITEGDWRRGLSLYQLAMADLQYLYDHPLSQRWTAYRIVPLKPTNPDADGDDSSPPVEDKQSLAIPRFHPSTFLNTLQSQVPPDVKAHYNFDRHRTLPLLILRIFILDSPYNTSLGLRSSAAATTFDTSRTVYIAFPDASPHVFISKPQSLSTTAAGAAGGESKSLRTLIVEGIPKALSRPRQRVTLKATGLVTRNLNELLDRKGAQRTNCAGGGWSVYADEKLKESPLDTTLPTPPLSEEDGDPSETKKGNRVLGLVERKEERERKRARLVAKARFGDSGRVDDGKGLERVDVVVEDPFTGIGEAEDEEGGDEDGHEDDEAQWERSASSKGGRNSRAEPEEPGGEPGETWKPYVRFTFHGPHVFAGIRQLVEHGVIDGERMPGWMTGEEGVSVGAVRSGRIRGYRGSGV